MIVTMNATIHTASAAPARRRTDDRCDRSAMAERRRVEMVAIRQRYISQVVGYALRNFGSLVSTPQKRGFRPPDLSLRTKIRQGGYQNQTHLRGGIPYRRAGARGMVAFLPSLTSRAGGAA